MIKTILLLSLAGFGLGACSSDNNKKDKKHIEDTVTHEAGEPIINDNFMAPKDDSLLNRHKN